jgi:predicted PurR-regulated permease PerM
VTHSPEVQKSINLWTIWMVVLVGLLVWCAFLVRDVLLLVYISGLLAVGLSPMVRLIERQSVLPIGTQRFPRWLAILLLYLVLICVLTGVAFLVFPPLIRQARQLANSIPDMFDRTQTFLISNGMLSQRLSWKEVVARAPMANTGEAVTTVLGALTGVIGGLFGFFTILILTFYLLVDAAQLRASFIRIFPPGKRARVDSASRDITVKVSAWLGGQLLLGGIIGATSALGLWLLGVPFFYVLALISAIGELIPVVGPVIAAVPALAVAATVSLNKVLLVLIFFVVQQQIENHLLVPKIMQRQVGISAVTVIVSLLIGGRLMGIVGALLAVPTAAILQVLISELTPPSRDPTA